LVAFSFGQAGSGVAEAINKFTGGGDFAERIKKQVGTLLSILDMGATKSKAEELTATLREISKGLLAFSGANFVDSLAGIGAGILNFFSGNESPMQSILNLADRNDDLQRVNTSLQGIANSLDKLTVLKFDGSKFNIEDFADDLEDAVDDLSDINEADFTKFVDKMARLREAFVGAESAKISFGSTGDLDLNSVLAPQQRFGGAEVDVRSREIATTASSPTITVAAPQTNVTTDSSTRVNRTTVATASPRRSGRSPQNRDTYSDPAVAIW